MSFEATSSASTIKHAAQVLKERQNDAGPKQPPSRRALEIYKRVVIKRERQSAVAEDLNVTPSRISHICRRVRSWLAAGQPGDPELLAHVQHQRLERTQVRFYHEAILDYAMRELAHVASHGKQTTTRVEEKDGEISKVVTTYRDERQSAQVFKVAQRAAAELQKLAEQEPPPEPQSAMPTDNQLFQAIFNVLCDFRRRAEHAGRVTKSRSVRALIERVLAAVLGRRDLDGIADDPAAREVIRALAIGTFRSAESPEGEQLVAEVEAASAERGNRSAEQETSAPPDLAALADELVPPPGGDQIPNPLLFLGPDERLPPAPTDTEAPGAEPASPGSALRAPSSESASTSPRQHATPAPAPSSPPPAPASNGTTPAAAAPSAQSPPADNDPQSCGVTPEKTGKLTPPSSPPPPIRVLLPLSFAPSPQPG